MAIVQETGMTAIITSLGGVRGTTYHGRNLDKNTLTVSPTGFVTLLVSKPERIAALIQNQGPSDLRLSFGQDATTIDLILKPLGVFQIDWNFPWTGDVRGWADGTLTAFVIVVEISVP